MVVIYAVFIPFVIIYWYFGTHSFQPILFAISTQHCPMIFSFMTYAYYIIKICWFFIIMFL